MVETISLYNQKGSYYLVQMHQEPQESLLEEKMNRILEMLRNLKVLNFQAGKSRMKTKEAVFAVIRKAMLVDSDMSDMQLLQLVQERQYQEDWRKMLMKYINKQIESMRQSEESEEQKQKMEEKEKEKEGKEQEVQEQIKQTIPSIPIIEFSPSNSDQQGGVQQQHEFQYFDNKGEENQSIERLRTQIETRLINRILPQSIEKEEEEHRSNNDDEEV